MARELGAVWAGEASDDPGVLYDAAIVFAPAGELAVDALRRLDKGGVVALGGIYSSPIPPIEYPWIYHERVVRSVANSTRQDARELLRDAAAIPIVSRVQEYELEQANEALLDLKEDRVRGSAVLRVAGLTAPALRRCREACVFLALAFRLRYSETMPTTRHSCLTVVDVKAATVGDLDAAAPGLRRRLSAALGDALRAVPHAARSATSPPYGELVDRLLAACTRHVPTSWTGTKTGEYCVRLRAGNARTRRSSCCATSRRTRPFSAWAQPRSPGTGVALDLSPGCEPCAGHDAASPAGRRRRTPASPPIPALLR